MKAKVLKYASCGNKVIRRSMELEPFMGIENIFTSPYDDDNIYIVFQYDKTFIVEGCYSKRTVYDTERADTIKHLTIQGYNSLIKDIPERKHIPLIFVELYKALGLDYQPLLDKRETAKKEREEERLREQTKRQQEHEEEEKKYQEELVKAHSDLKDGKMISKEHFLDLCKKHKVTLHIRTVGMLNACNFVRIGFGEIRYSARKGVGDNFTKVYQAAKELATI